MTTGNIYTPYEWQVEAWRDKSPILLLTGAAGGGKSRCAGEKVHGYCLKYPGATAIIGRKDKVTANRSVVPFMLHTVMGGTNWGVFKMHLGLFQYYNESQIWVVGLRNEEQREALRSIGKDGSVDIAWIEEANKITSADDDEIAARMRGHAAPWRQRIYTTNPDFPEHWINTDLILGGKAKVYYSRPEDNPANPPDYIETLKALRGIARKRLWLGLWVQSEGAVYDEFDASVHLIDDFTPPVDGRFFVSVDFGFTNPFTASLWYVDGDGVAYLYRQIYYTKRLVEDHAKNIRKLISSESRDEWLERSITTEEDRLEMIEREPDEIFKRTDKYPIEAWITDHDAEDRATLERHLGIKTKAAYKAVMPGIEACKVRLAENRVYFMRNALQEVDLELEDAKKPTCLIEEIPGYVWSDKKQDTPKKEHDHACDDFKYFIAHLDKIGRKRTSINPVASTANYIRGRQKKDKRPGF